MGGEQSPGRYWLQSTVTQRAREGRGLLREGHDCRLFQGPSGAIFNLFFCYLLAFVCCLESCVHKIINTVATNSFFVCFFFHTSASYFWWWEAFRSCGAWSQLPQMSLAVPLKDVFTSRGLADSRTKSTKFSFALLW